MQERLLKSMNERFTNDRLMKNELEIGFFDIGVLVLNRNADEPN